MSEFTTYIVGSRRFLTVDPLLFVASESNVTFPWQDLKPIKHFEFKVLQQEINHIAQLVTTPVVSEGDLLLTNRSIANYGGMRQ